MKKFSVDLIENSCSHLFSIDSQDNRDNIIKTRIGLLRRNYNNQWTSQAYELANVREAGLHLNKKVNIKGHENILQKYPFHPGKILRENQFIFEYLNKIQTTSWKLVFRASHNQRIILRGSTKEKKNNFNHYSILIKVKPPKKSISLKWVRVVSTMQSLIRMV